MFPAQIRSRDDGHANASSRTVTGDTDVKYVNLGATGLRVSRVCLGMMSYGNDSDRPWVLDEDAAEPIVKAAVDGGITFFDTADVYSAGASEVATGGCWPSSSAGTRSSRDQGERRRWAPGQNNRGLSRKHILSGIDASLRQARTWTTSTFTRFTAGITARPSRRP